MASSGMHHARIAPASRLILAATPQWLEKRVLAHLLNFVFRKMLVRGELDFLAGRSVGIHIEDVGIAWAFTQQGRILQVLGRQTDTDVTIRGASADFLGMATRRMDPDALFFQRRIVIEGNVELGLAVKNFMDALEWEELPWPLRIPLTTFSRMQAGIHDG